MGEAKQLVGHPILSQVMRLIPGAVERAATKKHNANRYYKKLPVRVHLCALLYGVLSFCNGLRELCEGMLGCEGKLLHLGLDKAPSRSTLSDANNRRSYLVFETLYFSLVHHYQSFISDSRLRGLSIRNLRIIDSTTIQLFSEVLRGVGRKPLDGGRRKGGLKVHALLDAFSGICEYVRITEARQHDRPFLQSLKTKLVAGSYIVFDKAYTNYFVFAQWSLHGVFFVTRQRRDALYHTVKVLVDKTRRKVLRGVIKDSIITVGYKDAQATALRLRLRRIVFITEEGKELVFITNNFTLKAMEVATIYKHRWLIELLFKQIKQNFPLRYFWGASPNAIKMQVYCVLIAQLLMLVLRKKAQSKKSFANIITVVRLHLMSYVDLFEFIRDTYKAWRKNDSAPMAFAT